MATSIFSIRPQFMYDKVINWFPGHMAKGLRVISERLSNMDLIVEARDARISFSLKNILLKIFSVNDNFLTLHIYIFTYIPLSSINHKFEQIAGKKDRIIFQN